LAERVGRSGGRLARRGLVSLSATSERLSLAITTGLERTE
jgi:hypothetical protein